MCPFTYHWHWNEKLCPVCLSKCIDSKLEGMRGVCHQAPNFNRMLIATLSFLCLLQFLSLPQISIVPYLSYWVRISINFSMCNYRQSPATGLGGGASVFPYAPDDSPMSAANIPTTVFDHGSVSMYKRPTVYDHSSIGLLKRKSIISGGSATGASRRKRHRPAASANVIESASGLQVTSAGLCCQFST